MESVAVEIIKKAYQGCEYSDIEVEMETAMNI